jgi:hypothetical protein
MKESEKLRMNYEALTVHKLEKMIASGLPSLQFDLAKEVLDEKKSGDQTSVSGGQSGRRSNLLSEVVITDISMSFGSMVVFMVKWSLASIPAIIILFVLGFIVIGMLGGLTALMN